MTTPHTIETQPTAAEAIRELLKHCRPAHVTHQIEQLLPAIKPAEQQAEQPDELPFWDILCHDCGWKGDSETVADECPKCGATGAQLWERMDIPKRPTKRESSPAPEQPTADSGLVDELVGALKTSRTLTRKYLDMVEGELDGARITELREIHYRAELALAKYAAQMKEGA